MQVQDLTARNKQVDHDLQALQQEHRNLTTSRQTLKVRVVFFSKTYANGALVISQVSASGLFSCSCWQLI